MAKTQGPYIVEIRASWFDEATTRFLQNFLAGSRKPLKSGYGHIAARVLLHIRTNQNHLAIVQPQCMQVRQIHNLIVIRCS